MKTALVVGATSYLGGEIIGDLLARGINVTASHVRPWAADYPDMSRLETEILHLFHLDPPDIKRWMKPFDYVIMIPPVTIAHILLPFLKEAGAKKLIVVSSHNASLFPESTTYKALIEGETRIMQSDLDYVIVRPTMIIGNDKDHTVSNLMRMAKQRKFLPMPGRGTAMQQPIDYLDLGRALVHAAITPEISRKTISVGGPAPLTLKALYTRIMHHLGLKPRILPIPVTPLGWAAKLAETFRIPAPVKTSQVNRIRSHKHMGDQQMPGWQPQYQLDDTLARMRKNMFPPLDQDANSS